MAKRWNPNTLTAVRLAFGLGSIAATLNRYWLLSVGLILLASLFDSWADRVARRLNIAAKYAREIDMVADLTGFGLAPATLYFFLYFTQLGLTGYVIALTFPIAGAIRLARFTVNGTKGYYLGIPLKIAGSMLAAIALMGISLPLNFHVMVIIILSAGVISRFKIPKLW